MRRLPRRSQPWTQAAVLAVLLLLLATLQYVWLGRFSRAEGERARASLNASAARFAEDFDRELSRAFLFFLPGYRSEEEDFHARRLVDWRATAPFPDIVRGVLLLEPGQSRTRRLDEASGSFVSSPWPAELADLRRRLEEAGGAARRRASDPWEQSFPFLADDVPALVIPSFERFSGRREPGGSPGQRPPPGRRPSGQGGEGRERSRERRPREGRSFHVAFTVLWLDREALSGGLLAELVERHFAGSGELEYNLSVVRRENLEVVYRSAASAGDPRDGDASAELFGFLSPEALRPLALETGLMSPGEERGGDPRFGDPSFRRRFFPALAFADRAEGGRWRLIVTHRDGSLETALAKARHRNLAVSLGILLLLALSMLQLLRSTRRAQRLARQQLEFVAGVSHELLTPLAAMRSAGQNLADGVVEERSSVSRYGALIEREGRRLSEMVTQVLEHAGIQAGGRVYSPRRVAAEELVDGALEDCRAHFEEAEIEVEADLATGLPKLEVDPAALRRALANLLVNAVKYGRDGKWIGVSARAVGGEVAITVEDRGPGIDAEDLPHLFEPFYRGRDAAAGTIPGSGLGLSLVRHVVEHHGGRIEVGAPPAGGSRFTLHLPAAET